MVPTEQSNKEGIEFYILQCQRQKYQLQAPLVYPWGAKFKTGKYINEHTYYRKFGRGEITYTNLIKSVIAHMAAHLVWACKFHMKHAPYSLKGGDPVYKISSEVIEVMPQSLVELWKIRMRSNFSLILVIWEELTLCFHMY